MLLAGSGEPGDFWSIHGWEAIATEYPDTRPAGQKVRPGVRVWLLDTQRYQVWDGNEWLTLGEPPQVWEPEITSFDLGEYDELLNQGFDLYTYMRDGVSCQLSGTVILGANGRLNGPVSLPLPFPGDPIVPTYTGWAVCQDNDLNQNRPAYVRIEGDMTTALIRNGDGGINLSATVPFTWAEGDIFRFHIEYWMART
jgi:hypothetical protein